MTVAIDVLGGVYRELVVVPDHEALLGSAGRAAAAIGPERARVTVHSALASSDHDEFRRIAESYGFATRLTASEHTIAFSYVHGLDPPRITPAPHLIGTRPPVEMKAERVLCFGAIDFDWRINAEQAVYDPQDAFRARAFVDRNSTVNRLALVLNEYEARQITGMTTADEMLAELFRRDTPEVVVLKCGARGTLVATRAERASIAPYFTDSVFKVGSGDVFSAFFAFAWMIQGLDALSAAQLAAQATAHYVSARALPVPSDFIDANQAYGIRPVAEAISKSPKVYLAGPFFTLAQRWLIEEARLYLREMGMEVFSPYHDVGYGPASRVAPADLKGIDESDIVFALASGFDPGTVFEIGYARKAGKPVVVYIENARSEDLKMFEGSDCILVNDFASSIYRTMWKALFSL